MKQVRFALSAAAATVVMVAAPAAHAVALTDGVWQVFNFGGVDSSLSGEPFTFSVGSAGAHLKVTDGYLAGDQFNITGLGNTSVPTGLPTDQIGSNWDAAFADARWSSRSWFLTAGNYAISGTVIVSPFGGGDGAIQVTSVPEPGTYALMALGLAGLGFVARRRKSA